MQQGAASVDPPLNIQNKILIICCVTDMFIANGNKANSVTGKDKGLVDKEPWIALTRFYHSRNLLQQYYPNLAHHIFAQQQ